MSTCANETHDHTVEDEVLGQPVSKEMTCGHCGAPTFYDYTLDVYRHARSGAGCWLIGATSPATNACTPV